MIPRATVPPLTQLVSLDGRCAVVTGAARGIGSAIARRLAEAGASVHRIDIDPIQRTDEPLDDVLQLDVTDDSAVHDFVAGCPKLDIWVNNAGIYPPSDILDTTGEQWSNLFDVNLRAAFVCSREAGQRFIALDRPGVIVNVAATAGVVRSTRTLSAHYCASKAALAELTRHLATELAPYHIRAVTIAPGFVLTEGTTALLGTKEPPTAPLGRVCVPDDVARAVLYAASDLADFVSGTVIVVDGASSLM